MRTRKAPALDGVERKEYNAAQCEAVRVLVVSRRVGLRRMSGGCLSILHSPTAQLQLREKFFSKFEKGKKIKK